MHSLLLERIMNFQIGSEADVLSFRDRLARENNWSRVYCDRCIEEYKKFIYLASISDKQVTPSDQVDQVWHLHLTYTRSYWIDLCQGVLNTPLHHIPTIGGKAEADKFIAQYQDTLMQYQETFGKIPPQDIWPDENRRFRNVDKFIRVNKADYWFLKKPSELFISLGLVPLFLVACTEGENESDIWFYIKVAVGIYIIYRILRWLGKSGGGGCSSSGCSSCGGGCGS